MLLGVIAGGAIQLLIAQVADETGVIKISAAAHSNLLFRTGERITAALLPKVGFDLQEKAIEELVAMCRGGCSAPWLGRAF